MGDFHITDGELEILETLWEKDEPIIFGELLEAFHTRTKKDWKKQTMNTFLFKMQQKKLVEAVGGGRFKKYKPLITKEQYTIEVSKDFLDKNYEGSVSKMLSALNGGEKLDKKEVDALKKLLEEWEKE